MTRKRKNYRRTSSHRKRKSNTGKTVAGLKSQLKNELTALLYNRNQPLNIKDISQGLKTIRFSKKELQSLLFELTRENIIQKNSKNRFTISRNHDLVTGTIEANPKGFGFLTDISGKSSHPPFPPFSRDAYISAGLMGTSRHGDTVLAQIIKVKKNGRPEARVIKILNRRSERLAGYLLKDHGSLKVIPEDPRYPMTIQIQDNNDLGGSLGDCVIVKILPGKDNTSMPTGRIIEVLGSADNVDVQMRLVIERHQLPHMFSKKAEQQSMAFSGSFTQAAQESGRADLRAIGHVTIDSESAKDFDDAIAVEKTDSGYRLYVSIADVAHFVPPGSQLDKEAYERGTSVYFPGRVIPMLPEKLSNDLCSLIPNRDRLTFTAILEFDHQANLINKRFTKSIIRSHHRFTYTTVKKIVVDNDPDSCQRHQAYLVPLNLAAQLAKLLQEKRQKRGSIHFTIPESDIVLGDDGTIESINRAQRNFAHEIIEEFMLAANEAVGATFTDHKQLTLYRIHERPDPEKVTEFTTFAETLDIHLPPYDDTPEWYNLALDKVKGSPREYVVNNLLLRTMQQARYDVNNPGHFGLAATDYCHFTSPIRRYPDLVVHRNLIHLLSSTSKNGHGLKRSKMEEMADHLSSSERTAMKAERDMNDRLKLHFMKKHIGESFDGVISGVNNFAFFVELLDLFISGSVALSKLTDDYYIFDEAHHRFIGELGNKVFQMGDVIKVTLVDVDSHKGRINFIPESLDKLHE